MNEAGYQAENRDGDSWPLPEPCRSCQGTEGRLRYAAGQHVLDCVCGRSTGRNVSKVELGLATRSVSSRKGISPSLRLEVMKRARGRCELCGRVSGIFHVGHQVSVKDGGSDDFDNLCWLCEECNLGLGDESMPDYLLQVINYKREARQR